MDNIVIYKDKNEKSEIEEYWKWVNLRHGLNLKKS